jgi:hypothetical protein
MFYDIPNKDGVWTFITPMSTTQWQTWIKPQEYSNFIIYVCGAGGGGGSGITITYTYNRSGGGGGGGGALTIINTPSYLLPETLYIQVGAGGAGGPAISPSASGTTGGTSYLCYYPSTSTPNLIVQSNGGGGGGGGQSNAASTGGAGGTAFSNPSIFSYSSTSGASGIGDGAGSAGSNFIPNTSCIFGGASGGGVSNSSTSPGTNGGNIINSDLFNQINGGISTGYPVTANSTPGGIGYLIKKPFTSISGAGGGSVGGINTAFSAGAGGSAIFGAGGGGGGMYSANSGLRNGAGGKGGDGFVIIIGY